MSAPTASRRGAAGALRARERLLPVPSRDDGYRSVLMLGTTGAGKTTLVRQLLGTHPRTERFPPTSTAKTTVAETEVIMTAAGPYRAAVTFASLADVLQHLEENVFAAALDVLHDRHDSEVLVRLLDHVDQRFRFSYVLGSPSALLASRHEDAADDLDDDDVDEDDAVVEQPEPGPAITFTAASLVDSIGRLRAVVADYRIQAAGRNTSELDDGAAVEQLESELDVFLREGGTTAEIVGTLLDEIRIRFDAFTEGEVDWDADDWPSHWTWQADDRTEFLGMLSRFTGNHAKAFGRLLTPLVNGIRVSGPFRPTWTREPVGLVLIDGEGLGHVPGSVAALSTFVSRRLDRVDAIVLVDNAMQPVQAAPIAALKAIAVSGNASKLVLAFTHFDQVRGDNMPTFSARERHVYASVENVLNAIREDLGPAGERQLRERAERASYFVGGLQDRITDEKKAGKHTLNQLQGLVETLTTMTPAPASVRRGPQPVFDRAALTAAIADATESFHTRWRATLGLQIDPEIPKEHWSRIKALTRRLARGEEEYRELKPAGELRYELQARIFKLLQHPVEWRDGELDEDERDELLLAATHLLTESLIDLTTARVLHEHREQWQAASDQAGTGSTVVRARMVEDDILEPAAPTDDPTGNDLVESVTAVVTSVGGEVGFLLR